VQPAAVRRNKTRAKRPSIIAASILSLSLCSQAQGQYVRLAKLEIDPAQLDAFKAAVT
jgi:hypothetical protein